MSKTVKATTDNPDYEYDDLTNDVQNPFLKASEWGWSVDPEGLRYGMNWFNDRFHLPQFIVENGFGSRDVVEDGKIHDDYRIDYLRQHIVEMKKLLKKMESIYSGILLGQQLILFLLGLDKWRNAMDLSM